MTKPLEYFVKERVRRCPQEGEWITLEGLLERVDGNILDIRILSIRLTENDRFTGSSDGSEFHIPISIDIGRRDEG